MERLWTGREMAAEVGVRRCTFDYCVRQGHIPRGTLVGTSLVYDAATAEVVRTWFREIYWPRRRPQFKAA